MRACLRLGLGVSAALALASFSGCDDGDTTTNIPSSVGSNDGGPLVIPDDSRLGLTCATNADCGTGLTCVGPSGYNGSGPGVPHGMCTKVCVDDRGCTSFGGYCASLPGSSTTFWCMLSCESGVASATKCRGRADLACSVLYDSTSGQRSSSAVCAPFCDSDADCAPRRCDPATQLCVDTPSTTPPLGTPCEGTNTADPCYGHCAYGTCVEYCSYGSLGACGGSAAGDAGAPGGACLYPVEDNGASGDLALCWPLCRTASDCANSAWICDPVTVPDWGLGACLSPLADAGVPEPVLPDAALTAEGGTSDGAASEAALVDAGEPAPVDASEAESSD